MHRVSRTTLWSSIAQKTCSSSSIKCMSHFFYFLSTRSQALRWNVSAAAAVDERGLAERSENVERRKVKNKKNIFRISLHSDIDPICDTLGAFRRASPTSSGCRLSIIMAAFNSILSCPHRSTFSRWSCDSNANQLCSNSMQYRFQLQPNNCTFSFRSVNDRICL